MTTLTDVLLVTTNEAVKIAFRAEKHTYATINSCESMLRYLDLYRDAKHIRVDVAALGQMSSLDLQRRVSLCSTMIVTFISFHSVDVKELHTGAPFQLLTAPFSVKQSK